ncbi:P-type conjugative transfer protein TrbL [Escherichia coli]|nr:P-type conjugative transfer protein TrbL [Escherichia coli]ELM8940446.1 P-type conjugative transfer protein TrbL [Escherichia coli]
MLVAIPEAFAQTGGNADVGFYDDILRRFQQAATGWAGEIKSAATWLFWTLALISMVWTFGMMALRKADLGEFFAEFVRFTIFTGFFWWLLENGPTFANSIIQSMSQLGAKAGDLSVPSGGQLGITPSGIVGIGFKIFGQIIDNMSFWPNKFHLSLMGGLMGIGILVMLALIGINMLLLLVSAWIMAYAGIFFLGFGGSRWTSDMAINYYRSVLGLAVQILGMVLLISIGKTFLDDYYATLQADISATNLKSMGALLIACVVLLALTTRIPPLLAGIASGSAAGGGGIGSTMGFGTLAAAGGMAAAAVATGGAAIAAGAASMAGGAQAIMAAASKANDNVSAGTDILSSMMGGGGGGSAGTSSGGDGGGSGGGGGGETPMASAAGDNSSGARGSSSGGGSGGGSSSGRSSGGIGATAAKGGRIVADTVANLAKGAGSVAKAKAGEMRAAAQERIGDTVGGKIAQAIRGAGAAAQTVATAADSSSNSQAQEQQPAPAPAPSFDDNSLSASNNREAAADADSEVASFVNKHAQS